jgi:phosphatidylserine/phosphatidylglycerophosphate/cardiolipin synthase-like enzyme
MRNDDPIEVMFLQQQGDDPFKEAKERIAQANSVASRIARFIGQAQSTLDIAIYDFRLHGEPASIISEAIRDRVKAGVTVRILFDAATNREPHLSPGEAPALLEADKKPPGTENFVASFADVASLKAITGYRVLMHNKYIVRDALSPNAAVFTGSANYTNDSWGLQENTSSSLDLSRLQRFTPEISLICGREVALGRTPATTTYRQLQSATSTLLLALRREKARLSSRRSSAP